ncbi:hypothetical protein HDU77_000025 [Chytriomyces hyalinus]|nr:hypothetical protein HDU77_000025 [Chytriomyces hyalinus]
MLSLAILDLVATAFLLRLIAGFFFSRFHRGMPHGIPHARGPCGWNRQSFPQQSSPSSESCQKRCPMRQRNKPHETATFSLFGSQIPLEVLQALMDDTAISTQTDAASPATVPPPAPASSEATPSQQNSPKQPSIPTQPIHSLIENDSHYVLAVEVPGFKKNELTLTVTDDTRQLVLSGQNGTRQPIHLKAAIPRLGDLNRLTAVHEDGILTVSVPKLERDGRVVEVTAGNGLEKEDAAYAF